MNTVWHFIWTYVIFRKKTYVKKTLFFSVLADLPWIISNIIAYVIFGFTDKAFNVAWDNVYVWHAQYFFNSFTVIFFFYIILKLFKLDKYIPYIYGWAFHAILDAMTHVSDAYPIFWPLTTKVFPSYVSYWQRDYYSVQLSILNLILFSTIAYFLLKEKETKAKFPRLDVYIFAGSFIFLLLTLMMIIFVFHARLSTLIFNIIPLIILSVLIKKNLKYIKNDKIKS